MSGRLDAFFSLTLCHALVACVLFASALSLYAPLPTSYYQLVSLTAFIYWVLVLFVLTVLTSTIQMVMRMVRLGSGQLLQRYQRVGVMLANPAPLSQTQGRRPTSQDVAGNNNSSSNVSLNERLRRLTSLSRQNNNNNNNNNRDNDDTDVDDDDYVTKSSDELVKLQHDPVQHPSPSTLNARSSKVNFTEHSIVFSTLRPRQENIPTSSQPLLLPPAFAVAPYSDSFGDTEVRGAFDIAPEVQFSAWHSGTASQAEGADAEAQLNVNNSNNPMQGAPSTSRPSLASSFTSPFSRYITSNMTRYNPSSRSSFQHTSCRPYTTRPFNTSTNSSSAFDVHWSNLWDQIAPYGETGQSASTVNDAALSELKTFTGKLVESVVAKLKAQYVQPVTGNSRPRGIIADCLREEDIKELCRKLTRVSGRKSGGRALTRKPPRCRKEPTTVDKSLMTKSDKDEVGSVGKDQGTEGDEGDDVTTDLLPPDDASDDEVEGLYTTTRHKLREQDSDDSHNADDDEETGSHVRSL